MASPRIITGEIIAITYPYPGSTPNIHVLVDTGEGIIELIFQGRTRVECLRVGITITARIVPLSKKGMMYAYNPQFTLHSS